MRRVLLLIIAALLVASLAACGDSSREDIAATAVAAEAHSVGPASTPRSKTEKLGEWAERDEVAMVARTVEDPAKVNTEAYEPKPGTRLVAVELEMGCLAGSHQFGPQLVKLVDTRGKSYERVPHAMADHEDLTVTDLHAGDRMRGWLAFEVPEGAEPAILAYGFAGYVSVETLQVGLGE